MRGHEKLLLCPGAYHPQCFCPGRERLPGAVPEVCSEGTEVAQSICRELTAWGRGRGQGGCVVSSLLQRSERRGLVFQVM